MTIFGESAMENDWILGVDDDASHVEIRTNPIEWRGWYQMSMFGPVYGWNKDNADGAWVYYV